MSNKPSKFNFNVSGIIRENGTGESLPNAAVIVKGTSNGTVTNLDGFLHYLMFPRIPLHWWPKAAVGE